MNRLNAFAKEMIKRKQHAVGYPINQNLNMKDFYQWLVGSGLCNVSMNNVGNPRKESALMNSHAFENEVIEYFAPLFGFKPGETWGMVTHSGTDGNMHGMSFGVKWTYLLLKRRSTQQNRRWWSLPLGLRSKGLLTIIPPLPPLFAARIHFKVQYQLSAMSNHNFRQPPFNSIDFSPPYKYTPQEH